MNKKQELINELRDIEIDTTKKEKKFDFRTALIELFKALYKLFESKKDVSRKDIVKAAKIQNRRLGLEYDWSKVFGLKEVDQSVEQQDNKQLTFANGNPYPDNFHVEPAISDGSCFFDSLRQGLLQNGIEVTVEQLRKDCKEFAQKNPPEWFTIGIANSYDNYGNVRRETITSYGVDILDHSRWGDPEVEGRILCEKYGVKLHIIERQPERKGAFFDEAARFLNQRGSAVNANDLRKKCLDFVTNNQLPEWFIIGLEDELGFSLDDYKKNLLEDICGRGENEDVIYGKNNIEGKILSVIYGIHNFRVKEFRDNVKFLHQIVDKSGSTGTGEYNRAGYNDNNVLHIINNGGLHFEPLLDRNKNLTKQQQQQTQDQMERQVQVISSFMINAFQEHLEKQPEEKAKLQQEDEDRELAAKLQQEEDDYELAMKLQKQENNLFMIENIKTFKKDAKCYVGELLEEIVQGGGTNRLASESMKAYLKPSCSMQETKLTHHQHQYVLTR